MWQLKNKHLRSILCRSNILHSRTYLKSCSFMSNCNSENHVSSKRKGGVVDACLNVISSNWWQQVPKWYKSFTPNLKLGLPRLPCSKIVVGKCKIVKRQKIGRGRIGENYTYFWHAIFYVFHMENSTNHEFCFSFAHINTLHDINVCNFPQ